MDDFRKIFDKKLGLSTTKSLVYITPPTLLTPFKEWGSHKSPFWWKAHNRIKHDRLVHEKLATIEVSLNAMAGLFLAIVQQPSMITMLLRHGWLNLASYNPDLVMPLLADEDRINKMKSHTVFDTFLIRTNLFATTVGATHFPNKVQDIKPLLYIGNNKLVSFLGKWSGND